MGTNLFFWLGGIFVQDFEDFVFSQIERHVGKTGVINPRELLLDWAPRLQKGEANLNTLFSHLSTLFTPVLDVLPPESLLVPPLAKNSELYNLLSDLKKRGIPLWLMVDYPKEWVSQMATSSNLLRYFKPEKRIWFSGISGSKEISSLPGVLQDMAQLQLSDLLVIDPDIRRAMSFVRAGVQCIHFVNAAQTKRELVFRKLL
ncbi:MAG: hypothetical protein HPY59_16770 [Anaerolineae bacterium]|nr:hypothetical protein [Anaerolineae bacterium]